MKLVTILYSGHLKTKHKDFVVKRLSTKYISDILLLQDTVMEQLEDKASLEKLSQDEFRNILEGNGLMIGAFVENKLFAIRALLIPPIDDHHLGRFAGLTQEELPKVIYQEVSLVHPEYRGNRMQQQLAHLIMNELENSQLDFQYVCCTVAPFNIPSLKDKFNQRMKIKALEKVYGEKLRYVFIKDLLKEDELEREENKFIPMDDIEMQQRLLASEWEGIQLVVNKDKFYIQYTKRP